MSIWDISNGNIPSLTRIIFGKKNKLDLLEETVTQIDPNKKTITLSNESILSYDSLVLATGSIPNKFGWPGENLKGVQGLYTKQDLENLEELTPSIEEAVIVGGGAHWN